MHAGFQLRVEQQIGGSGCACAHKIRACRAVAINGSDCAVQFEPPGIAIGPSGMSNAGGSNDASSLPDFDVEDSSELDLSFLETSSSSQCERPGVSEDFFRGLRFAVGPAIALWAVIVFVISLIW